MDEVIYIYFNELPTRCNILRVGVLCLLAILKNCANSASWRWQTKMGSILCTKLLDAKVYK